MPSKKLGYKRDGEICGEKQLSKHDYLLRLRSLEVIAYHKICGVFRAQGYLTPDKLKLLREIAAALYIPEVRHRAECRIAVDDKDLTAIAESVAGPNTDIEWRKEGRDIEPPPRDVRISTNSLLIADAVAKAGREALEELEQSGTPNGTVTKTVNLKRCWYSGLEDNHCNIHSTDNKSDENLEVKEEKVKKENLNEEEKDGDLSSSLSSATDESQCNEEENKLEEETDNLKPGIESDPLLHPPQITTGPPQSPPPNVITVPPPSSPNSVLPVCPVTSAPPVITVPPATPLHPVITVPPSSSMTIFPTSSSVVALSDDTPVSLAQVVETPVLSDSDNAQFLNSLPPLVVVPPPEQPAQISPSLPTSTIVLPSGMSIQLKEESKKRKKSISQDSSGQSAPKTLAFSNMSKMSPVVGSASTITSTQGPIKVTPITSRGKMTTTTQASSTQKVIIVSNASSTNTPILQRSLNMPVGSVGLPVIRASHPRLQTSPGQIRPKLVTVPAKCRAKGSSIVNLQLKNAITLKQDNVTVLDTGAKKLSAPAKILPKPPGSMFIVNTSHGTHKLAPGVGRIGGEGSKQNVVIVQKGGTNQRAMTLTNTSKDLVQKLMSKKCVVIQSSKMMPKTISPKSAQPQPSTTSAGNVVVLDLSQEQYRQNLSSTTIAEILQASGLITSTSQPVTAQNTSMAVSESEWLPIETNKNLALEEVSLPIGQSESVVTLDEAVELLGEQQPDPQTSDSITSDQIFTIAPEELASGDLTLSDKPETVTSQIVIDALPTETVPEEKKVSQTFLCHRDGAVTIQHSNFDMPANLSLEEYSSQQLENQNFN